MKRETLESLTNAVSTDATRAAPLVDGSYASPCATAVGNPCGGGTLHNAEGLPWTGLPAGSDLLTKVSGTSTRTYKVWDIADGKGGVAYKKVTVTVTWTDPV